MTNNYTNQVLCLKKPCDDKVKTYSCQTTKQLFTSSSVLEYLKISLWFRSVFEPVSFGLCFALSLNQSLLASVLVFDIVSAFVTHSICLSSIHYGNLYSASSRLLLRSTSDPCTAKKKSFEARVECVRKNPGEQSLRQRTPFPHIVLVPFSILVWSQSLYHTVLFNILQTICRLNCLTI